MSDDLEFDPLMEEEGFDPLNPRAKKSGVLGDDDLDDEFPLVDDLEEDFPPLGFGDEEENY